MLLNRSYSMGTALCYRTQGRGILAGNERAVSSTKTREGKYSSITNEYMDRSRTLLLIDKSWRRDICSVCAVRACIWGAMPCYAMPCR